MRIFVQVFTTTDIAIEDYDYVLVDLTPQLARTLATRRHQFEEAQRSDEFLASMWYRDVTITFLAASKLPESWESIVEEFQSASENYIIIPENRELESTEKAACGSSDKMVLMEDGFCWIEHLDQTDVETYHLPYDLLSQLI